MYYIFVENNQLNNCGQAKQLTEGVLNIEVSEELYVDYENNPLKYIYKDGQIVLNPNYEEELVQERKEEFNKQFFKTSLGYVRREVTMANGSTKDFLSDLLPTISMGINLGQTVSIITYNEPDFHNEITDEYMITLQNKVDATEQFVQECFMQLNNDFTGM